MGFTKADFPPVDPETFLQQPLMERMKALALHWVEHGFGSPRMIHTIYVVKLLVFYVLGGITVATWTSHLPPFWDVAGWWNQPIVYEKAVLWTLLLETIGVAGSWGPLAGKFKPMTGGIRFWARPGTIRLRPWRRAPFTAGDRRTWFDVALYLALLVSVIIPLVLPGVPRPSLSAALPHNTSGLVNPALLVPVIVLLVLAGLRDKTVFLAARGEQYLPALLFFTVLPFVNMITAALAALLLDLGGKIETGAPVTAASQLPPADVTLFDLAPGAVAGILGDRLPARAARAYRRYRHGPGAFKVDFAVEDGVPWTNPDTHRAGTVHLGGTFAEIAATERDIHAGRMPERPFVLVGQQYLADPGRSVGNVHPVWTYAHVPHGYTGDATEAIVAQIERFAPGFRDRIVGRAVRSTTQMAAYNPNYVGGDIVTGAKDIRQVVLGPRATFSPYRVGVPGMYICSAATPPGPGVHGMCGANAAADALRYLRRHQ